MAALLLGAGRQRAEEQVDPAVGLKVFKRLGDRVEKSEKLLEIHYNDDKQLKEISGRLLDAYRLSSHPVKPPPLILKTLS
jgi:pyrimidine-nucleoside phosphorylase